MNRLLLVILFLFFVKIVFAQESKVEAPDPRGAFLRSLAVPGWGHHYVDKSGWARGKYHIGADAVLILSFLGLNIHSDNLQHNWFGYTQATAGINIEDRSRSLQLAVGDFNSLEAYNDFQARSRNWDQFIDDTPENRWNWQSDAARDKYNDLRNRFENIDQQLPALIGLMVVNRVISAVSAYNRARKVSQNSAQATLSILPCLQGQGIVAHVQIGL